MERLCGGTLDIELEVAGGAISLPFTPANKIRFTPDLRQPLFFH